MDSPPIAGPWRFAADGEGYERLMGRWSRRLAGPFLDFVGTGHDERVLDVGCGTGNLAFAIAERAPGGTLVAIDLAPSRRGGRRSVRVRGAGLGVKGIVPP